jgi:hypothetical protein
MAHSEEKLGKNLEAVDNRDEKKKRLELRDFFVGNAHFRERTHNTILITGKMP